MIINKKGFTLIELLIVIAILAVLGTIVVVALNPAELMKQSRDAKRITDLNSVKNALSLYVQDVTTPNLCLAGLSCSTWLGNSSGICTASTTTALIFNSNGGGGAQVPCGYTTAIASTTVDGKGWVDVNLNSISGGSPIAVLPLDPTNSVTYFYAYKATTSPNIHFELNTRLESIKHRGNMTTDGGNRNTCDDTYTNDTCLYEIGTFPGLSL